MRRLKNTVTVNQASYSTYKRNKIQFTSICLITLKQATSCNTIILKNVCVKGLPSHETTVQESLTNTTDVSILLHILQVPRDFHTSISHINIATASVFIVRYRLILPGGQTYRETSCSKTPKLIKVQLIFQFQLLFSAHTLVCLNMILKLSNKWMRQNYTYTFLSQCFITDFSPFQKSKLANVDIFINSRRRLSKKIVSRKQLLSNLTTV